MTPLLPLVQVRALCQNPNGGIPATFLSSQQSDTEAIAVKKELSKVRAGAMWSVHDTDSSAVGSQAGMRGF